MRMDLNCDMGESFGTYTLGRDQDVMAHITSANIACGFHAGDPVVMARTVALAKQAGVGAGAHPGYPDLMGFGRRDLAASPKEVAAYVTYQIGALLGFCRANGLKLQHVKPHGALYNKLAGDEVLARAVVEAVAHAAPEAYYLALAGPKGDMLAQAAGQAGLKVAREAFPDRAYTPQGALAPRSMEGAVIHDPAEVAARALKMAMEGKVIAIDGSEIELSAQTLCVHGDNPEAVALVKTIREGLETGGVAVKPLDSAD